MFFSNIQRAELRDFFGGASEEEKRYRMEHTPSEVKNYREMITERVASRLNGPVKEEKCLLKDQAAASDMVKRKARELGADLIGVTRVDKSFIYLDKNVEERFAISLAMEMHRDDVGTAPSPRSHIEAFRVYYELGEVTIKLASFIRGLGYPAYAHIPLGSRFILQIPVAVSSGLALLGRSGIGITKEFGTRFRLGCVTTDLPLIAEKPPEYYREPFCDSCIACWKACPAGAISKDLKEERGLDRYVLDYAKCRTYMNYNYSCGICLKVCPYDKFDRRVKKA